MIDPLNAMLQTGALANSQFPPNSRYHGLETATLTLADGRQAIYLKRRLLPQPEDFALLQEHVVTQGERLDNITAHYLGDPEQFWQLCDANRAMRPEELTETIGRTLRITLPRGIAGMPNA
ncbi:MAG: LysM domain-containing protein [Methylococcales bacterium]